MRQILTFFILLFSFTGFSQSGELTVITVNSHLKVISDITEDSIPNGRYIVMFKNNTLLKGRTKNGKMDGTWISYYFNSQQKIKGLYVNGKRHGEWTYWGPKGDVLAKFQFNHGEPIGHWQGYYPGHQKAMDLIYNPKGEYLQCVQYYPSGPVALNFEYTSQEGSVKTDRSYYFENFKIFQYEQRTDELKDGMFQRYFSNGVLWESYMYENGALMEVEETRSKGGMPRKNEDFRNGNGTINKYYPNGNTYSKTTYKNGFENGPIQVFDLGGNPTGNGQFENGVPVGTWDIYSKYHTLMKEVNFDTLPNRVLIKRPISPAPKEFAIGPKLDGCRHGEWKAYDAYGDLTSVTNYKYGYKDGKQTYYQTKKITREFNYSNGNKNGKFTYFNTFEEIISEDVFVSESTMDSNWYIPPTKNWISVLGKDNQSNKVKLYFYPPLPGLELMASYKSHYDMKEYMFMIKRKLSYSYWPELNAATFPGGYSAEKDYILNAIKIPNELKSKRINGSVLLRYMVDEFGIISEIKVLKSIGLGLDKIAVNTIKSFPPLNPATFNGIPIQSYVVREIDFNL